MSCNQPVYRHDKYGRLRPTPCKRCLGCRNDRREDFTNRIMLDLKEYGDIGSFITLTYRDSELPQLLPLGSAIVGTYFQNKPPLGTLYKKDLKDFMDNLNHKVKRKYGKSIKYIASGEYGDEEHRPHYHAIVLGLPHTDRQLLLDTWKKGRIDIQPVTHADTRYTISYIDKQIFGVNFLYENYGDYQEPFGLYSKGLGQLHYKNNQNKYDELGRFYTSPTKYIQLNEYYKNKYGKIKASKLFPKTTINFAKNNNTEDLHKAHEKLCQLREEKIIKKTRSKRKVIHDTTRDNTFNFKKM